MQPSDLPRAAYLFCYAVSAGLKLHRHVAVPSMVVTGLLGSLGGYLWAFQNSSFRLQGYKANAVEVKQYITSKEG